MLQGSVRGRKRRRRGTMVAELLLVFPILVGFLLGTIEFSMAFYSRQQLLLAAREATRVGARGGSDTEITATAQDRLGTGPLANANVSIVRIPEDPTTPNGRNRVQVCLAIGTTVAVPNLIPWLVDLTNEQLVACVTMNIE